MPVHSQKLANRNNLYVSADEWFMKILQGENHNFSAMKEMSFSLASFQIAKIDSEGK